MPLCVHNNKNAKCKYCIQEKLQRRFFKKSLQKFLSIAEKELCRKLDDSEKELVYQLTPETGVAVFYFTPPCNGAELCPIIIDKKLVAIHYDEMLGNHYQKQRYLLHKDYYEQVSAFLKENYTFLHDKNFSKFFPVKIELVPNFYNDDYNWYEIVITMFDGKEYYAEDTHDIQWLGSFSTFLNEFLQNRQTQGLTDVQELIKNRTHF